jgi:hypothetical protein
MESIRISARGGAWWWWWGWLLTACGMLLRDADRSPGSHSDGWANTASLAFDSPPPATVVVVVAEVRRGTSAVAFADAPKAPPAPSSPDTESINVSSGCIAIELLRLHAV